MLDTAINVARQKEQKALAELVKVRERLSVEKQKYEALKQDQQQRHDHLMSDNEPKSSMLLQDYQAYMDNLDRLLEAQLDQINQLQAKEATLDASWQTNRTSLRALEKVIEREERIHMQQEELREQVETDERNLSHVITS